MPVSYTTKDLPRCRRGRRLFIIVCISVFFFSLSLVLVLNPQSYTCVYVYFLICLLVAFPTSQ